MRYRKEESSQAPAVLAQSGAEAQGGRQASPVALRPIKHDATMGALPLHYIRFPENPYFVGREDFLLTVSKHLCRNSQDSPLVSEPSHQRAFAIWAPNGFGKTQLARKFVHSHAREFPSILWVFADSQAKIVESYATYAVKLGLSNDSTEMGTAARALLDWYATTGEPESYSQVLDDGLAHRDSSRDTMACGSG